MTTASLLKRLQALDTNTVSDALDFLGLPGATYGLRPLWDCPKVVGLASTIQLGPKTDAKPTVHLISPVIAGVESDDRVLVIAGGIDGISCWGDILANAAVAKKVRGSVIDGLSRDIEGSESIGYPVYGKGVTMISARNRVIQTGSGEPVVMAGVTVTQDDFVIADRCGAVFVPAARIEEVLGLGERIARRQDGMVQAVRAGRSVADGNSKPSTQRPPDDRRRQRTRRPVRGPGYALVVLDNDSRNDFTVWGDIMTGTQVFVDKSRQERLRGRRVRSWAATCFGASSEGRL